MNASATKAQNIERGRRLREERTRQKKTIVEMAADGGVSRGSQILYEKGNPPTADYLAGISEAGADTLYILTGRRELRPGGPIPSFGSPDHSRPLAGEVRIDDEEYSRVRLFDVDASAGNGLIPAAESWSDSVAFSRSWLVRNGIVADLSALVRVRGDSMAPTIPDGAYILVDRRARMEEAKAGVYLVRYGETVMVKRLQVSPDRENPWVALISDNPSYPPVVVSGSEGNEFFPIAKVRFVIAQV